MLESLLMKPEKENRYDYRLVFRSPYAFHGLALLFALSAAIMAVLLPADRFLLAPGVFGDKWGLLGLVAVLLVIEGVNFVVASLAVSRDKVLFWAVSAASAVTALGVLLKVASVAYFW